MTFTKDHQGRHVVHITYNIDSPKAKTIAWTLPFVDQEYVLLPAWQQNLRDTEEQYDEENELDGHAMTRTYGIDASPLGDLIAVNSSNHPTDGVEYVIASDQISSLAVTSAREVSEHEILPTFGGPSHPSGMD